MHGQRTPLSRFSRNMILYIIVRTGVIFNTRKLQMVLGRLVTVVAHGSKNIPIGTMNSIVRQSGIPKNEWLEE